MLPTTQTQTEGDNMTIKVGDKVVYNNTDYEPRVMQGDVGVIEAVYDDGFAYIDFGNGIVMSAYACEYTKLDDTIADTPTLWCDMTDAQQLALFRAKHEGKGIEYYTKAKKWGGWVIKFHDEFAYRIKPTPKVETLNMSGQYHFGGTTLNNNKYRISLQFIDGKPDPASIKMEEL